MAVTAQRVSFLAAAPDGRGTQLDLYANLAAAPQRTPAQRTSRSSRPRRLLSRATTQRTASEPMQAVLQFHRAFGLPAAVRPQCNVTASLAELRIDLLVEEVGEFVEAVRRNDLVAIADALADITYVTYGAAVTYGIDLDAVVREVHRSNMSKLGADGKPVKRPDGKVLKPATYRPPDIAAVLDDQPPLPFGKY